MASSVNTDARHLQVKPVTEGVLTLNRRVVVTGLGLVTPVGNTLETTWAALLQGQSGADYIKKFDADRFAPGLPAK